MQGRIWEKERGFGVGKILGGGIERGGEEWRKEEGNHGV